jgi:hypothetical protein
MTVVVCEVDPLYYEAYWLLPARAALISSSS